MARWPPPSSALPDVDEPETRKFQELEGQGRNRRAWGWACAGWWADGSSAIPVDRTPPPGGSSTRWPDHERADPPGGAGGEEVASGLGRARESLALSFSLFPRSGARPRGSNHLPRALQLGSLRGATCQAASMPLGGQPRVAETSLGSGRVWQVALKPGCPGEKGQGLTCVPADPQVRG